MNRTTLGLRGARGRLQPRGRHVRRHQRQEELLPRDGDLGALRGPRGGGGHLRLEVHRRQSLDIQASTVGFVGIAVALLGRSTAIGVGLAAFIFGALEYGTTRGLDPEVFDPTLAGNLSLMIQGLVVLFVGADLLILYLWSLRRKRFASPRMSGKGA